MSSFAVSSLLEQRLAAMVPLIQTAWENLEFTPQDGVPFQQPVTLFARPANPTIEPGFYREQGYMQVTLQYPINNGAADARNQADAIRGWFARGLTLSGPNVKAHILTTPEIGSGSVQGDRYVIPVRVYFTADVTE